MFTRATLSKSERLTKEQLIASLFEAGQSFLSPPFVVHYQITSLPDKVPAQFLASVSKRKFAKATDRNRLKRRMKEAYRINKVPLYTHLLNQNKQLAVALIYNEKKITSFNDIESKIKVALSELISRI